MMAMAALALAGCGTQAPGVGGPSPHAAKPTLSIAGSLSAPPGTLLPADAQWVVELRDLTDDRVMAEQREGLR
jgi:hypothetical protein